MCAADEHHTVRRIKLKNAMRLEVFVYVKHQRGLIEGGKWAVISDSFYTNLFFT